MRKKIDRKKSRLQNPLIQQLCVGPDGDLQVDLMSLETTGYLRYPVEGRPKGVRPVTAEFDVRKAVVPVLGIRTYFLVEKRHYASGLPN